MNEPQTVVDAYRATPRGGVEYAAAELTATVARLLYTMGSSSFLSGEEIGGLLDIDVARVQEILLGDGNVHISTLAKAAHALGYKITITAERFDSQRTIDPCSSRARTRS